MDDFRMRCANCESMVLIASLLPSTADPDSQPICMTCVENIQLREALEGVLGAIRWTGWNVDDEKWKGPMREARKILNRT